MTVVPGKTTRSRGAALRRLLLRATAVGVLLLAIAWLLRQQVLAPLLRPHLETMLATTLGAERVSIGSLDGDWVSGVDAHDVDVERAAAPLRELRGVRVEASYSLWGLLHGELSALDSATITAAVATLDVTPPPPDASRPKSDAAPFDPQALLPLLRLCRRGATLHIDDLRVIAPHGERRGPLHFELGAGTDERTLTLSFAGLQLTADLRSLSPGAAASRANAKVCADDPGALLDLFGIGAGVRDGRLEATVAMSSAPCRLDATIDLAGLTHAGHRLDTSRVVASLDGDRLAIEHGEVHLPGVEADFAALTLPSPWTEGATALERVAGSFAVRLTDLSSYAAMLPASVQTVLPITGQVSGSIAGGVLHLATGELHAFGADLALAQGSFAVADDDWRTADGSLLFVLTLRQFATTMPFLEATTLSGRVSGTVAGSMTDPRLEARIDLADCSAAPGRLDTATGTVRADSTSLVVERLHVEGIRVTAASVDAPTTVTIDASCRLHDGTIAADSLVATVDVESLLAIDLLAPLFAEHELGPPPTGPATVHLEARHTAAGLAIDALRVRTAAESPIAVNVDGTGALPIHWGGTGPCTATAQGELLLEVSIARRAAEAAPFGFAGTLRLGADSTAVNQLALDLGAVTLRGEVGAERGVAALLEGHGDLFATTPLRVALDLALPDLAKLPAAWLGSVGLDDLRLRGSVTGRVAATGTPAALAPDVQLSLLDGEVRAAGLLALTGARLDIAGRTAGEGSKTILLDATLSATLVPEAGPEQPIGFAASIRSDANGTTLVPTTISVGDARLPIELTSNLRLADLVRGIASPAEPVTVTGRVGCRALSLETLPQTLLGIGPIRGTLDGDLVFEGAPGAAPALTLVRSASLSLRDGDFKLDGMPRFEHVEAEVTYEPHELALRSASGLLGAGRFTAHGSLHHATALLPDAFDDAVVDVHANGDDVLLYREDGTKVRATVQLQAAGTPRALQVTGDATLGRGSKHVRRITVLPDLNAKGGATASEGLHLFEMPAAIGERMEFDVAIRTAEPFEVRTDVFDGAIDAAARLRGKGTAPYLEGTLALRSGILRFPGANLRITGGQVTFTRTDPLFPDLLVRAEGKRMGILISMTITGRYDRPEVQLSSVPPLPPQELLVLLSTGQLPATLAEGGALGQARFVGGYLAKEVYESWFGSDSTERGESFLDRLSVETGREVSKNGTESVLVEYELWPNLALRAERDSYEDYNLGIVLRFRFR